MFKDYYKFPLKKPKHGLEFYEVVTADNKKAFNWCTKLSLDIRRDIISRINGNWKQKKVLKAEELHIMIKKKE